MKEGKQEGRRERKMPNALEGKTETAEQRRPHCSQVLWGTGAQGSTRWSLTLPSPSFPEAPVESRIRPATAGRGAGGARG